MNSESKLSTPRTANFWLNWAILAILLGGIALAVVNINRRQLLIPGAAGSLTSDAVLALSASSNTVNVGSTVTVDVSARSQANAIYGADLVLAYDKTVFEVTNVTLASGLQNGCSASSGATSFVLAPIKSETDCSFDLQKVLNDSRDGTLSVGVVAFNWAGSSSSSYRPTPISAGANATPLVRVTLKALKAGASTFTAQHQSGSTTDTNVASVNGTEVGDILASVNSLSFTVTGSNGNCDKYSRGDVNCDGTINLTDFSIWRTKVQGGNVAPYDPNVNGDQFVNIQDFSIIAAGIKTQ